MSERTVRHTCKEQLRPTPEHERALDAVVGRCRARYHTALEHRITAWQRSRVSLSRSEREAEVKAIRTEVPDDAALHSHLLHDVLARLDTTSQACFRRLQRGEGGREEGRLSPRQGPHALPLLPLQGVGHWRAGGEGLPCPVHAWAYPGAVEPTHPGHAQDGHPQSGGRGLVGGDLLRCCSSTATPLQPLPP